LQLVIKYEEEQLQEAQKRNDNVEHMSKMIGDVSDRLNKQQEVMEAQRAENSELREKLTKMADLLVLSDQLREKYQQEVAVLEEDIMKKVLVASFCSCLC
jgi:hypothetical protein